MDERRVTRRGMLTGIAALGASSLAGCVGAPSGQDDTASTTGTPDPPPTPREIDPPPADPDARYAEVYDGTVDTVAMITALGTSGPIGQGSGFIYAPGYLLTNEHVVRHATEVELEFPDERWDTGTIVGEDPHSDLAVVELDGGPGDVPPLEPADHRPTVGQEVMALGSPFGLEESVSLGIVSGINRNLPTGEGFSIPDTVQTDAGVNPGNSGGPLVTMRGRYLGVITARQGQEIAFAVSWRLAERVAPALLETGSYDHAYMGIYSRSVDPAIARANDFEAARGVMVVDLVDGGPADGILQGSDDSTIINGREVPTGGDVILALDGHEVSTGGALSSFLALYTSPGHELAVTVRRDGVELTEYVELGTRPPL